MKTDRITDNAGFRLLEVLDLPLISDLIHIISSTLSQVSHRDSPESLSVAFLSVHSLEVYGLHWFLLSMLQCCNEDSPVLEIVRRIGLGSNQQNLILLRYFSPLQWGLELLSVQDYLGMDLMASHTWRRPCLSQARCFVVRDPQRRLLYHYNSFQFPQYSS